MKRISKLLFLISMFAGLTATAEIKPIRLESILKTDTAYCISLPDSLLLSNEINIHGHPSITADQKKKLVSAMLAFPFPFGFMGAHRVMLGCKPWVPVVYVATFGGCFGILPLIDFIAILSAKDIHQYENNSAVFMWMK